MLTAYQCDIVAYSIADSGGYLCEDCATIATSTVAVAKADKGLSNAYGVTPVIRYSLDELNGVRAYEYAEGIADEWIAGHPTLSALLLGDDGANYARLIDHIADRSIALICECCDDCGAELT